ncbi:unnamed protein product [Didymodactylos carnosus]|uniref:NAD(P)(+)--arginine ADP-ribosyltransferase n=1 Tax=Didymodactylos carnosus TaxID=1234261 RepID=A0A814AUC8_9BILA|nr:unnamed protein product [Didymodactylos carnosus]CAF1259241.1 unnamed protein product [Didymodactylos carnosus]CAF3696932.1 unnamed protein product [Didymodactylos carnosus]CAF4066106.1 unnamed protein product [Didymodactylos carnosus]
MDDSHCQTYKRVVTQFDVVRASDIMILNKYENLTIIWFSDNIDAEIRQTLEQLHQHIILCYNYQELTDSINEIQNHKIILIVSGQNSRETLTKYHQNSKVDSFYIFCMNSQFYQDLVHDKKYSKLIGIYTEYAQLFAMLERELRSVLRHLSIFKIFEQNNKSLRDLDNESVDYSFYQTLRDILLHADIPTRNAKQEMIDYCRSYYHRDDVSLKQIDAFFQSYKSTEAVQWYTKNFFPFNFVNKALRTEDVDALFNLRYFIIDLCKQLQSLFNENWELYQEIYDTFNVYRGLTLSQNDIDVLKNLIGKCVSTNGFLSTSQSHQVAQLFGENVLFEIKVDTELRNIVFANIAHLSMMPDEEEVLFDLGTLFQITNVEYNENDNKWIVSMIGISDTKYRENPRINDLQKYAQLLSDGQTA